MTAFRTLSALILTCLWAVTVQASLSFDAPPANLAHLSPRRGLAHRQPVADDVSTAKVRRAKRDSKRCKVRDTPSLNPSLEPAPAPAPEQKAPAPEQSQEQPQDQPKPQENAAPAPQENKEATQKNAAPAPQENKEATGHTQNAIVVGGLINVQSDCGDTGATQEITATSGPNGNIDWLNCRLNEDGWNPPYIRIENLVTAELNTNGPFSACGPYIDLFYKHGGELNLPPILLAAFAMQESSCNPDTVGGGGEQGLMQLSRDKCGGAPGGNCKDPDYNIRTGAKYFADTLAANNGDVLLTIGMYNGWPRGLTFDRATAAAHGSCCRCQNNLDYLHQFVNGWLQNINAYNNNPPLGKYFNLNVCGGS